MGRMFTGEFNGIAVTVVQDLFQIEAVTNPVTIHKIIISQHTDVGDAAAEALLIRLRGEITNAVTDDVAAAPLNSIADGVANLCNLAVNETTQLITGAQNVHSEAWNIALPFIWAPTPEERYTLAVGDAFVVDLATAPADSITVSGTIYFEEW